MYWFFDLILNMVFPPRCLVCDCAMDHDGYCKRCEGKVIPIAEETCFRCGIDLKHCECDRYIYHFDGVVAPFFNEDYAQEIIYNFKFKKRFSCVSVFGDEMARSATNKFGIENIDLVTFVPAELQSERARGYNQSELLAKRVAETLGKEFNGKILKKRKKVKTQHKISRVNNRYANVKDAFYSVENVKGKNILLVDDIKTTGATLDACARELKFAGADKVYCVTALVTRLKERTEE